ncbi:TniQ family protein [Paraburkholderia sediminicola]|uniref:TniQ family protein n=1 Tax=Paraburkholderia sediminicola TaxID=458836 RepID=UPI0038BA6A46
MYFPQPYPDELLGSLFIRACHHLGLTPRMLIAALSEGSDSVPSFIYPGLIAAVARHTGMSAHELLWEHTVFPHISIALDSARRDVLEAQILDSNAPGSSLRLQSTFPPHIEALTFRRSCEVCQRHDRATWGEDYWHRIHALPGVLVCPIHGSPLSISHVPLLAQITKEHNRLPHEVDFDRRRWPASEPTLRDLASEVKAALRCETSAWDYCLRSCQNAATSRGYEYGARAKSVNRLAIEFEHYFGSRLLEELGLPLLTRSSDAWPVELLRGRRPAMQLPLRLILLRSFLLASAAQL